MITRLKVPRGFRTSSRRAVTHHATRRGRVHSCSASAASVATASSDLRLAVPDPGVEPGVANVHDYVGHYQYDAEQHHDALHHGQVVLFEGDDNEGGHPRQRKHGLQDHVAPEEASYQESNDGENRAQ